MRECGERWPHVKEFVPTPCCGARGGVTPNAPTVTWPDAVRRLKQYDSRNFYESWNDGVTDADLTQAELQEQLLDLKHLKRR